MKVPKQYLIFLAIAAIALLVGFVYFSGRNKDLSQNSAAYSAGSKATTNQPTDNPDSDFNKQQHSLTSSDSIWVIVNKRRPLPVGYQPNELVAPGGPLRLSREAEEMKLRATIVKPVDVMFSDAKAAGLNLMLVSGYRSEGVQRTVYNGYVKQQGQAAADTESARPGYSEHQTGLAFDVGRTDRKCELEACFGDTAEGKWIAANAHKYGFVVRYPANKQLVTGYVYEPWHLRYVGTDLAKAIKDSGQTLEEFFTLPAAPDYQ